MNLLCHPVVSRHLECYQSFSLILCSHLIAVRTYVTIDCLLRYVRVVSLSSAPGCEPDIVTQLVEKVGDVIGDWLSGAKKSILGREILDSVERSRTTRRHDTAGDIKKRNKAKSKIGRKDSVKTAEESPPVSRGTDIKIVPDEKDALTIGDSKKSKKNQKKRRSYFGSKDRPNGDRNRSSEESENRAIREDSRHDGAGRKIFVCSGRSIDSPMLDQNEGEGQDQGQDCSMLLCM